jgi:hypothetical protein
MDQTDTSYPVENKGNASSFLSMDTPLREEKENHLSSFSFTTPKGIRIDIQTLEDVISSVPEERRWVVEGILPDSGLAVLGGRHKRGKSTLVIHLGRSVSLEGQFLGRATQKRHVIYVNYEMPLDYFSELSKAGPIPKDFYVINRPEPRLKAETVTAVIEAMKERGFSKGLLIVDSFRGAFKLRAEQENQSGEAGVLLRLLQEIAIRTGWLIFVVHHHKKGADQDGADNLSGTSDFGAAPDVIWTWERPADASKPGTLEIEGRIPPVEPLTVKLSPEGCVYLGPAGEQKEDYEKQRILEAIGSGRMQPKENAKKTGVPYSTVKKRLNSLHSESKVDYEEATGKGSPKQWFCKGGLDLATGEEKPTPSPSMMS